MKKYIHTQQQLNKIKIAQRREYYLDRNLIQQIQQFSHADEALVSIRSQAGFLVQPFWEDTIKELGNSFEQKILDLEGDISREYALKHSGFTISMRNGVWEKLLIAHSLFPTHIAIVLKAAYRPIAIQRELFQKASQLLQQQYSEKGAEEIYSFTLEYVTDPDNFVSPHATGGAIDIHLFDTKCQKLLDMGSPINTLGEESWTFNMEGLTEKQIENRLLITNTMIQAGFANLPSEWWHYSYGDPRWAVYYNKKQALYNVID